MKRKKRKLSLELKLEPLFLFPALSHPLPQSWKGKRGNKHGPYMPVQNSLPHAHSHNLVAASGWLMTRSNTNIRSHLFVNIRSYMFSNRDKSPYVSSTGNGPVGFIL